METLTAAKFRFGDFEMDCSRRALTRRGEPLTLHSKSFDLLVQLVENCGNVLSKDELLERVWPGQFVEENNLTVQISALRKVFGARKGKPNFIVTVPGRGYSFVQEVERIGFEQPFAGASDPESCISNSLIVPHNGKSSLQIASPEKFREGQSLFGRDEEIAKIKSILRPGNGGARLIVLTGAGGSGKTRLAQAVGGELSADFPDGVFFVELAAVHNAELVASVIANTLDLKESGETLPIEALKTFLRERRMLLILDNFEQLISAAPIVKEILASSSSLKILVTSRVALRLNNEREFAVLPLSVPPKDVGISAEQLNEYAAIELFVARAAKANQNFSFGQTNASTVAEICRRLDGLPLAIELAAARLKLLPAQSILFRLENSLKLLTGGAGDLPARQRTMRGTIEWSYDLLDKDEKILFQRLAVFAGGFSVEAAEAIGEEEKAKKGDERIFSESQVSSPSVLDLLTSLVDNNLLVSKGQTDGSIRLQMLEVVREFALEYLEKSGEAEAIRHSHADFFLALAEEAEPNLFSGQSIDWLDKLETENDNLRAALQLLLDYEPDRAARMASALGQFWINRSYLTEARRWLEAALEKSENQPNATRFKLLNTFSLVARNQGDYAATRRASEESLAASRAANDLPQIILSCHAVAGLATREGNFTAGRKLLEEALTISRELGDEKQIAFTLSFLGNLFLAEGKTTAAVAAIEESLVISRRHGFRVNVSTNLTNLGSVAYYEGDTETSHRHFAESLTICREMGNKILVSCCLDGFAAVAASREKTEQAACLAGAAENLREAIGYEIELTERIFRDDYLEKVRASLREEVFTTLYEQGKTMNLDEALALALGKGCSFVSGVETDDETEIVIESRTVSRVVIEGEYENGNHNY